MSTTSNNLNTCPRNLTTANGQNLARSAANLLQNTNVNASAPHHSSKQAFSNSATSDPAKIFNADEFAQMNSALHNLSLNKQALSLEAANSPTENFENHNINNSDYVSIPHVSQSYKYIPVPEYVTYASQTSNVSNQRFHNQTGELHPSLHPVDRTTHINQKVNFQRSNFLPSSQTNFSPLQNSYNYASPHAHPEEFKIHNDTVPVFSSTLQNDMNFSYNQQNTNSPPVAPPPIISGPSHYTPLPTSSYTNSAFPKTSISTSVSGVTKQAAPSPMQSFQNMPPSGAFTSASQTNAFNKQTGQDWNDASRNSASPDFNAGLNADKVVMPVYDLLKEKNLFTLRGGNQENTVCRTMYSSKNCSSRVFRSTLNCFPQSNTLLSKSRLPLGIIVHPFADEPVEVVRSNVIVRCRMCRTYINPFVSFVKRSRWRCNICFHVNEIPEDFLYDAQTHSYGDGSHRSEIRCASVEYLAPSEYMIRPPIPALYVFVIEISYAAISTGYLNIFCETLVANINDLPNDNRTQIGIIAYDSSVHFFLFNERDKTFSVLIESEVDDVFLPFPDCLLVNLNENKVAFIELVNSLPKLYEKNVNSGCAFGAAVQIASQLIHATGGRISAFVTQMPNIGPGKLCTADSSKLANSKPVLTTSTDFYKKLALDCSSCQVCVDIFVLGSRFIDLFSLSCVAKHCGGEIKYFFQFTPTNYAESERFRREFTRYLVRPIGFEAVMRVRCTRGIGIYTFFGSFFVRATDLLSLPVLNPDASYGMQIQIEDDLSSEIQFVSFQTALLYTNHQAERRIRVHTYTVPVSDSLTDVFNGADSETIVALVARMAVDCASVKGLEGSRIGFTNVGIDVASAFRSSVSSSMSVANSLYLPLTASLLPLYMHALIRSEGFSTLPTTPLDLRCYFFSQCNFLPVELVIRLIYPALYAVHNFQSYISVLENAEVEKQFFDTVERLPLSSKNISSNGVYIMDTVYRIYLYIGSNTSQEFLNALFGVDNFNRVPFNENCFVFPNNKLSNLIGHFVEYLTSAHVPKPIVLLVSDESTLKPHFVKYLIEDHTKNAYSLVEFYRHIFNDLNK